MHNLGLGGLEFSPTHTVDQHRPEGFRLSDIIIEPDIPVSSTAATEENPTSPPLSGSSVVIPSKTITDDNAESVENGRHYDLSIDMWNSDLWQDIVFKQMHDPKHRHPRHHGKLIIKLYIVKLYNQMIYMNMSFTSQFH